MSVDQSELRRIADDIVASLPECVTPPEMHECITAVLQATKDDYVEFRLKLLMHCGLFIDDTLVDNAEAGLDKDSLIRIVANELLMAAALLVRSLKKRIGEELSPARCAIVFYEICQIVRSMEWDADLAEEVLHDKSAPGALRAELERHLADLDLRAEGKPST